MSNKIYAIVALATSENAEPLPKKLLANAGFATGNCRQLVFRNHTTNMTKLHKLLQTVGLWPSSYSDFRAKYLASSADGLFTFDAEMLDDTTDEYVKVRVSILESLNWK